MKLDDTQSGIGVLLATTEEELKGKLRPAEVRVEKETLVEATRAQNRALLFICEQLTRLETRIDGVEANLTKRIDDVDVKIEQWGSRVETLEIQTEHHKVELNNQKTFNSEVDQFRRDTQDSLAETREGIRCLDEALKELPHTINIKTTQVYHAHENDADNSAPVITVEDSIGHHAARMDEIEVNASNEIKRIIEWVEDQKNDSESKINLLRESLERVELEMKDTISYAEVEEKIATKVRELVDQIKEALLSVEEDEADFKNVANALHGLFNSLKETKADKSEMAQLRDQLINTQLNNGPGSGQESKAGTLDYKSLRKILSSYCKTELVDKKLDGKAGKEFTAKRLDHTESMIDKILETIDELWFVLRKETMRSSDAGGTGECGATLPKESLIDTPSNNLCRHPPSGPDSSEGEDRSPKDTLDIPSEHNIRQQSAPRALASIKEDDQPNIQPRSTSFSAPVANRSKTESSSHRNGSFFKFNHRPCTSPGNLTYYLTSIGNRQDATPTITRASSIESKAAGDEENLFVHNGQSPAEEVVKGESLEMVGRRRTQFFQGRATAL